MSEEIIESVLKDLPGALDYPKFHLMTWRPIGIFDGALADDLGNLSSGRSISRTPPLIGIPISRASPKFGSVCSVCQRGPADDGEYRTVISAIFADNQ